MCGREEHPPKSTRKQKAENREENPRNREVQRQRAKKARDAKARDARQKQGQASKPARQRFARLQRRWAKRVVKVLDNPASSKLKTKYSRDAESFTPEVQELFKSIREELKQNRKKHEKCRTARRPTHYWKSQATRQQEIRMLPLRRTIKRLLREKKTARSTWYAIRSGDWQDPPTESSADDENLIDIKLAKELAARVKLAKAQVAHAIFTAHYEWHDGILRKKQLADEKQLADAIVEGVIPRALEHEEHVLRLLESPLEPVDAVQLATLALTEEELKHKQEP